MKNNASERRREVKESPLSKTRPEPRLILPSQSDEIRKSLQTHYHAKTVVRKTPPFGLSSPLSVPQSSRRIFGAIVSTNLIAQEIENDLSKVFVYACIWDDYCNLKNLFLESERRITHYMDSSRRLSIVECSRLKQELNTALIAIKCAQKKQCESSISPPIFLETLLEVLKTLQWLCDKKTSIQTTWSAFARAGQNGTQFELWKNNYKILWLSHSLPKFLFVLIYDVVLV